MSTVIARPLARRPRTDGFVDPCIPTLAAKPPSGPDWVHEIKHDGYRLIVRRDGKAVRLFTRRGHDWTDRYPGIAAVAGKLRASSFTLDGEAAVSGDTLDPEPAGVLEHGGTVLIGVLIEHDAGGRADQQPRQLRLALAERQRPKILAVELQPVERMEDRGGRRRRWALRKR
jgi:hypothetical protein